MIEKPYREFTSTEKLAIKSLYFDIHFQGKFVTFKDMAMAFGTNKGVIKKIFDWMPTEAEINYYKISRSGPRSIQRIEA